MKAFAAAALFAFVSASEEMTEEQKTTACNNFKTIYESSYDCNADGCTAKLESGKLGEAAATTAWRASHCEGSAAPTADGDSDSEGDSAAANVAAFGALAAAAAALAF